MSMRHDESASFILQAEPFFIQTLQSDLPSFFEADDYFKVKITLIEVQSEEDYLKRNKHFCIGLRILVTMRKLYCNSLLKKRKLMHNQPNQV
jgi:hypothetical protein